MSRPDLKELYLYALGLSGAERESWLQSRCAEDPSLILEVKALLSDSPTAEIDTTRDLGMLAKGEVVGAYKVLELIGEGGFGSVYLAEQQAPVVRRVALKILRKYGVGGEARARFEAERQALAMLSHANVARILDAGADGQGRPYFVMELAAGHHITKYCDSTRQPVRERLRIMLQVCDAIQHAHSKGIIHRDIKPANVIVCTRDGNPHVTVIDFGVAKSVYTRLTDMTLATSFHGLLGTPDYMSPEQAGGEVDVDTRADVYSLGVLAYELVTGERPFEEMDLARFSLVQVLKTIREIQPQRPSAKLAKMLSHQGSTAAADRKADASQATAQITRDRRADPKGLIAEVRGEIDWIIMRAMDKEPDRRYQTASEFAADLRRYLESQPVLAAPPSVRYRLSKVYRKHKAASFATIAGLTTVISLLVVISVLFSKAIAETRRAEESERETQGKNVELESAKTELQAQMTRAQLDRDRAELLHEESLARQVELERELYFSVMQDAGHAWHERAVDRLAQSLERADASYRGWEWQFLSSQYGHGMWARSVHESAVNSVAVSPEGDILASVSDDLTVRISKAHNGELLPNIRFVHRARVLGVEFTGAGSKLITWSADGTAILWDVGQGKQERIIHEAQGYRIVSGAYSQKTRLLAIGGTDGRIRLIRPMEAGEPRVLQAHMGNIWGVAYNADGSKLLTVGNDAAAAVWDTTTGERISLCAAHTDSVTFGAFLPDGISVLTSSNSGQTLLWNAATGEVLKDLSSQLQRVDAAVFDPSSTLVAMDWNEQVAIYDTRNWRSVGTLWGLRHPVTSIAFSQDGTHVIAGDRGGTIKSWLAADVQERRHFPSMQAGRSGVTSDGCRMVLLQSMAVQVSDLDSGDTLGRYEVPGIEPAQAWFTPDGQQIVVLDEIRDEGRPLSGRGVLLNAWTGKVERDLLGVDRLSEHIEGENGYHGAVFSPQGTLLLGPSKYELGLVAIDWATGAVRYSITDGVGLVNMIRFSPDGKVFATASSNGFLKLWRSETGDLLYAIDQHERKSVLGVAFSPNGECMATWTIDNMLRSWRTSDGAPIGAAKMSEPIGELLALTNDGRIAVTHSDGSSALVWDLPEGRPMFGIETNGSTAMSIIPNGSRLVWVDSDGRVLVHETESDRGREILEVFRHGRGTSHAFFLDDNRLVVSGQGGTAVLDASLPKDRTDRMLELAKVKDEMRSRIQRQQSSGGSSLEMRTSLIADLTLSDDQKRVGCSLLAEAEQELRRAQDESLRHIGDENATPEQRKNSLLAARRAADVSPNSSSRAYERAVAAYKAGEYQESLDAVMLANSLTLEEGGWESEAARNAQLSHPSYIAYLTLARIGLGQIEEARESAALLHSMIESEHNDCTCYRYAQQVDEALLRVDKTRNDAGASPDKMSTQEVGPQ